MSVDMKPLRVQLLRANHPNKHEQQFLDETVRRGVPVELVTTNAEWRADSRGDAMSEAYSASCPVCQYPHDFSSSRSAEAKRRAWKVQMIALVTRALRRGLLP